MLLISRPDERDLVGKVEEALMDEEIPVRQEDSETRMRVIPADDLLAFVFGFQLFVNVVPRLLRERELGFFFFGVERVDGGIDFDERTELVLMNAADENAAHFARQLRLPALGRTIERVFRDKDTKPVADVRERLLRKLLGVDAARVKTAQEHLPSPRAR